MFQRFTVVMEYQQKPVLPPPFIAFSHCYTLLRYLIRKAKGRECRSRSIFNAQQFYFTCDFLSFSLFHINTHTNSMSAMHLPAADNFHEMHMKCLRIV